MSPTDRYRRPADLPPRIPVFPLRGAILLPRATLPLNVFEPRYLEMLDDVMAGRPADRHHSAGDATPGEDEESPRGKAGRAAQRRLRRPRDEPIRRSTTRAA